MINPQILKWAIISALIAIILALGISWFVQHNKTQQRDGIARLEGENIQLRKQDSINQISIGKLTHTIDSAKANLFLGDTVVVYQQKIKIINYVKNLSADSSIEFLRKRISK